MTILLKNCNIIDVKNKTILKNYFILIENNIISEVSNDVKLVEKNFGNYEKVYDLNNNYLIPGIINMHQHYLYKKTFGSMNKQLKLPIPILAIRAMRNAISELREGITTARIVGSLYNIDLSLKYLFERNVFVGPTLFISGQALGITGSHVKFLTQCGDGERDFRKMTRERVQYVDWVKVFATHAPLPAPIFARPEMSLDELKVVTEEAHNAGKRVAAHAKGEIPLKNVIEAGVDTIEHGIHLTKNLAIEMARKNISLIPTLTAVTEWQDPAYNRGADEVKLHQLDIKPSQRSFKNAVEAGVRIGMGLDSLGILSKEVLLMKEISNFSNLDILEICTLNGARILGVDKSIGSIEKGKIADIVVLNKNPEQDLSNIKNINFIIKKGKVYTPDQINLLIRHEDSEYNTYFEDLFDIDKKNKTILCD